MALNINFTWVTFIHSMLLQKQVSSIQVLRKVTQGDCHLCPAYHLFLTAHYTVFWQMDSTFNLTSR